MALAPASSFGPYRIIEPLGRGGMAAVYKAYEAALDRYVAVKVLPAEFLHDPTFAERFRREAKVVARLEHPNIIPIFAFDIEQGTPWMAMRMIAGGSLSDLLKQGPLPKERIVAILAGVAAALDYAHGRGAIHRDVKPQNVLLDEDGRVYLADFGIARMVEVGGGLTQTGMISGTPQYMAPEQATAQNVDHRADIYALGIMAYEMFTGHVPFSADTPVAVLMKHVQEPIPLPPPGSVPEPVVRAILKCTAKQAADRWATGMEFVHALQDGLGLAAGTPGRGTTAVGTTAVGQTYLMRSATGAGMTAPSALPATALGTAPPVSRSGRSALWALAIVGGVGVLAVAGGVLGLFLWSQGRPEIPAPSQPAGGETPAAVPPVTLTQPQETMPPPVTIAQPIPDTAPADTLPPVTAPASTLRPPPGTPRPTPPPTTTTPTPQPVTTTTVATPPPPKRLGHPFKLGSPVPVLLSLPGGTQAQMVSGPTTLKSVLFKQSKEELQVEAEARVDEGKDQKVTINVTLLDADGKTVLTGQGAAGIDEGDTGKIKFKLKLGTVAVGSIVGFEISVASVPD